ncbi:MAG: flagellar motor switch protein FliN [Armatimonadota bacterium]|nr:flagellar motor switch protein FliN [Armatimonadota bacterium]
MSQQEERAQKSEEVEQPAMEEVIHANKSIESPKVELSVVEGNAEEETSSGSSVRSVRFGQISPTASVGDQSSIDLILDVSLDLSVELGRTSIPVRDVLQLGPGSVIELDKLAGEPVDIMVNGKLIARGEVVVVDENFGVRVTEIASCSERLLKAA